MKKTLLVSFIALALVFSSAGVCFADDEPYQITDYPDFGVTFSQVNPQRTFFKLNVTDLSTSDYVELFNGLFARRADSSSNLIIFMFDDYIYDPSTQSFNPSGPYYYFQTASNGINLSFASTSSSSVSFNSNSWASNSISYDGRALGISDLGIVSSGNSDGQVLILPPSLIGEVLDFAVPAGYAFVIDGECEIIERSYYINNSWNFRNIDNYRVNGSLNRVLGSSSIRDGFSPDRLRPSSELIHWEAINPNIFGTASTYEFYDGSLVTVGTGETYVITNPTLYGYGSTNSVILNTNAVDMICSVYIQYSTRPTLRWVAIESLSEYSSSGSFSTYSVFRPDLVDEEGSSSSGSGGTIITPENNLPTDGGNHGQPSVNDDSSLLGIFSRLTNLITNLFRDAIDAVQSIINAGSSFMQMVSAMFSWLPSELLGVLTSALVVIIVVGVVKLLL